MICTLSLAVFSTLENFYKSMLNPDLTLVFSVLGYTLRPTCIFLFILLNDDALKGKYVVFAFIPLLITVVIYCLSFFPDLKQYVVYFRLSPDGTKMDFEGGILRYTSHVVAAGYLLYLLIIPILSIGLKKLSRSLVTFGCSLIIIAAVVAESFFNPDGKLYVLNTSIAVVVFIYYLYLNIAGSEIDEETGLYKNEVFIQKTEGNRVISGGIIFDIDVSSALSDPNGKVQEETHQIYSIVANVILKNISRKMVVFRIQDERFFLVAYRTKKEVILSTYERIKEKVAATGYMVNMGYALKNEDVEDIHDLFLKAEKMVKVI